MKPVKEMSQAELAAYIHSILREHGIDVVLSGGASVVIYSEGKYVSMHIDLVNAHFAKDRDIEKVMHGIGFSRIGRHFEHPDTDYDVEFPPGSLTIRDRVVESILELTYETGTLRVLSPTECVMDRLSHYYHWGDRQCLVQAEMVAARNQIDLNAVMNWSESEGNLEAFNQIRNRLKSNK
jgi:hypothetical protein